MLKITVVSSASTTIMKLEGALTGPWVDELQSCWNILRATRGARALCVDLVALTRIGPGGKELLGLMYQDGVSLISGDYVTRAIVDEVARPTQPPGPVTPHTPSVGPASQPSAQSNSLG